MKQCRKCKAEKPEEEFYFANGKPRSRCKECVRADNAVKVCIDCGIQKPLTHFHMRKERGDHHSRCKPCFRRYNRLKAVDRRSKPKGPLCYQDYLKQAGLQDYYKRTMRYM